MKKFADTEDPILLRTFFGDDAAWKALCETIQAPVGEEQFKAVLNTLSDHEYDGATIDLIIELAAETEHGFMFVADRIAHQEPEHAVLVVDLGDEPGRHFRVIPSAAWSVENNLSLANMDFHDFLDAVDARGIFRGFPEPEKA